MEYSSKIKITKQIKFKKKYFIGGVAKTRTPAKPEKKEDRLDQQKIEEEQQKPGPSVELGNARVENTSSDKNLPQTQEKEIQMNRLSSTETIIFGVSDDKVNS